MADKHVITDHKGSRQNYEGRPTVQYYIEVYRGDKIWGTIGMRPTTK